MVSFLMECPQCGVMMPKGSNCSDCNWSEDGGAVDGDALMIEYRRRYKRTNLNYAIVMLFTFLLGFLGLTIAALWFFVIYRGNTVALLLIGVLTVISAVLGLFLAIIKKCLPTALYCPACDARIDELGGGDHCPCCRIRLR